MDSALHLTESVIETIADKLAESIEKLKPYPVYIDIEK